MTYLTADPTTPPAKWRLPKGGKILVIRWDIPADLAARYGNCLVTMSEFELMGSKGLPEGVEITLLKGGVNADDRQAMVAPITSKPYYWGADYTEFRATLERLLAPTK